MIAVEGRVISNNTVHVSVFALGHCAFNSFLRWQLVPYTAPMNFVLLARLVVLSVSSARRYFCSVGTSGRFSRIFYSNDQRSSDR